VNADTNVCATCSDGKQLKGESRAYVSRRDQAANPSASTLAGLGAIVGNARKPARPIIHTNRYASRARSSNGRSRTTKSGSRIEIEREAYTNTQAGASGMARSIQIAGMYTARPVFTLNDAMAKYSGATVTSVLASMVLDARYARMPGSAATTNAATPSAPRP
jgi:hypothetical protein